MHVSLHKARDLQIKRGFWVFSSILADLCTSIETFQDLFSILPMWRKELENIDSFRVIE